MLATKEDILACFRLLLAREPNPEEIGPHFSHIGFPLDFVVSQFLESPEFRSRRATVSGGAAELVHLDDFAIYVAKDDPLIAPGIRAGCYEPEVTRAFLEHMGDGTVLDIGANCGYYSLVAASRGRTVYAFEPLSRNLRLLHASVAQNGFPDLHIIAAAASDCAHTARFTAVSTNGSVGGIPADPALALASDYVWSVRVDDVVPHDLRVSLIKIDVEGHEYSAIRGAAQTIRRSHPVILSEFSPHLLESPAGYLHLLRSLGYRLSAIGRPDVTTDEGLLGLPKGTDHIDILALPIEHP